MAKIDQHCEAVLALVSFDIIQKLQKGTDKGLVVDVDVENIEVETIELKEPDIDFESSFKEYYAHKDGLKYHLIITPEE